MDIAKPENFLLILIGALATGQFAVSKRLSIVLSPFVGCRLSCDSYTTEIQFAVFCRKINNCPIRKIGGGRSRIQTLSLSRTMRPKELAFWSIPRIPAENHPHDEEGDISRPSSVTQNIAITTRFRWE